MRFIGLALISLALASCYPKPEITQEYPTKYPETPTNGSWEEFKP
jgi:hypothetical protein